MSPEQLGSFHGLFYSVHIVCEGGHLPICVIFHSELARAHKDYGYYLGKAAHAYS